METTTQTTTRRGGQTAKTKKTMTADTDDSATIEEEEAETSVMPGGMRVVGRDELDYVRAHSVHEDDIQRRLREKTNRLEEASWASVPEVCQFLALMVEMLAARRVLEIGVFTGLGTLAMAYALPPGGKITACDIPEARKFTDLAREAWEEAGVSVKIDFREAPAIETMDELIKSGAAGSFEICYIDADKKAYDDYYERALTLLAPGGLILIDNTLWSGSVLNPDDNGGSSRALDALNKKLHTDKRVTISMLPMDDGLTLALKRTV